MDQTECHSVTWHALVEMKHWSEKSNSEELKASLPEVGCKVEQMMHDSKDKMAGLMGSDHDETQKEGGLVDLNFASLVEACHLTEQVLEMKHGLLESKDGLAEQGLGVVELGPGLVEVESEILT